jgi:NADPH:quinone reductase-like Zn-dependent oxidoreductase
LIGGETQARSWRVLKAGGTLVSTLKQPDPGLAAAARAIGKHYMAQPNGAELAEIARLIDQQKVTPHIARIFPLEQAAEAETALEHDHLAGKVVLSVAEA